jgi:hypothetical protein
VPDSATKELTNLSILGMTSLQLTELLKTKKASALELQERAEQLRAEQEVARIKKEIAKRDDFSEAHPPNAPTVEGGMYLEDLTLITEEEENEEQAEYKHLSE